LNQTTWPTKDNKETEKTQKNCVYPKMPKEQELQKTTQLEMWANAQPDGRPAEYR